MPQLLRGTLFGSYRLSHCLGEGGMGEVWAARDIATHAFVALKFTKTTEAGHRRRFAREARVVHRLRHPNVVRMHGVLPMEGEDFAMVMELLAGETLEARVDRARLTMAEVARFVAPVIDALAEAHAAGVIHRDVKPANVLLAETHQGIVPKLLDFGIARLAPEGAWSEWSRDVSTTNAIVGTPGFMAPEQVRGERVDARADVWACGMMIHVCLTGVHPFGTQNPFERMHTTISRDVPSLASLVADVPLHVSDLVTHMLARDPARRLADLSEARNVLASFRDVAAHDERRSSFWGKLRGFATTVDAGTLVHLRRPAAGGAP